jgi:TorA maturation chaperone TorD
VGGAKNDIIIFGVKCDHPPRQVPMKRVFLLSSHPLFGQGVESLLRRETGLEIVGCERDVDKAMERIEELWPDVVIVDSSDPGVDLTPEVMCILRERLGTKIIGLNLHDNTLCIYRGEQRVVKEVEDLVEAIEHNASDDEEKTTEAVKLLLEARIFAYDLLKQTFIEEPTRDFLKALSGDHVIRSFPFAREHPLILEGVNQVSKYLSRPDALADEAYEKLHWDYTRMFIGPYKLPAPLWESAYLNEEHLLFQAETLEVRRAYLKYGFLPRDYPHGAEDHLGLELDFMYQLSEITRDKMEQTGREGLAEILEDQKAFLGKHLLKWVPDLAGDIVKSADTEFYKGMAKILKGYLELDRQAVEELLDEVKSLY